jgi:hypothetical protein
MRDAYRMGRFQRQGGRDGGMEPLNRDGDRLSIVEMVNDVYRMMLDVTPPGSP